MHDSRKSLGREQLRHRGIVGEIDLHEAERGLLLELGEACLFERNVVVLVEIVEPDDFVALRQQPLCCMKADESRSSGDQDFHKRPSTSEARNTCLMSYST